ncbi:chemotaxis protein CheW [Sphingomonas nostoxanthinifaciens]|uniref:chemotaxis protein CheW n=1 Tax=Sphingomonas nostoxanthinifaciens TaxID=2872652 RepID=UPI001CC1E7B9|nr:chemotaxis protein CheW [Sphingomonas nostoxanthinifaciens]UAK24086.1 chemotaxis protein CheW [Sphingomonas nostoxanthinifaciens]
MNASVDLPAQLDTLAALRLPRLLVEGACVTLSAARVEAVGLAALQWLAVAQARGLVRLVEIGDATAERIRDAGLGAALLGDVKAAIDAPSRLRFSDAALDFGREPLELLGALRAAGAAIAAVLPAALPTPDNLAIAFDLRLPDAMSEAERAALFAPFADCALLDADDAPIVAPATADPVAHVTVPVVPERLEQLAAIIAELTVAQANLIDRLGNQRGPLATEIADVERLAAALQDAMLAVRLAPLETLVGALPAGGAIEIERAVGEAIAPALAAVRAAGSTVHGARAEGGFVRLILAPAPTGGAHDALAVAARGAGGRIELDGDALALVLPRTRSLVDAIIVELGGASYALPVQHMIEALQPTPELIDRFGPDRLLLRFRGRHVPVVMLGARLGLPGWCADPLAAVVIVAHAGGREIALMVDAISDQRQIVALPFAGGLAPPPGTIGAAIVRGNRIALILDVDALA